MRRNMHCETLETRIHELLDQGRGLADDPAIAEHVASCSECAEVVAAYQAMVDGVDALPAPEPSAGFLDGIIWPSVATYSPNDNGAPQRMGGSFADAGIAGRQPSVGWIAAAATLAIAASLMVITLLRSTPDSPNTRQAPRVASIGSPEDTSALFAGMHPEQVRAVCQTTGRRLVSLPAAVRRVTAESDTEKFTTHIRPVVGPMGAAWKAVKRKFPSSSNASPDPGADTGSIRARDSILIG